MNNKTIASIVLSATFGFGAVFIAKNWLDTNQQELSEEQVQIAVATMDIPTGTIVEPRHISLRVSSKTLVPESALYDPELALGKLAKGQIYEGDIIRSERLVNKGDGSTLASLISENMRAVSIRVNDVVGVAGFLLPGNRVDILNTFNRDGNVYTEVILVNVKILAIDQSAAQGENTPQLVRAVTIELTLQQAESLMNARSKGSLQLALRNPVDNNEVILSRKNTVAPTPNKTVIKKAPQVKSRHKVELIRGIEQESIQIKI